MHIPRTWARAQAEVESPQHGTVPLVAWGSGDDAGAAQQEAEARLARLGDRVRRGEPFPARGYDYGSRPIREQVLETIGPPHEPRAVLTRNRYGATVMNAARLLFLDVDLAEAGPLAFLGRLLGRKSAEASALEKLKGALERSGKGAFRVYRTAAGFRALCPGREFDPAGREAQDLMKATGTDPWFVKLCLAQRSFRARLTPKPWRIGLEAPPGEFPRMDPASGERFARWLQEYEAASPRFATCRYLETVGKGGFAGGEHNDLVAIHDRATRATESLPLA